MILNTGLRTDIPGFFSKWFYNRIDEGFVYVRSPYAKNQIYSYKLNPELIDCIIFCTKNPKPMFQNLEKIDKFNQFWQITITPYEKEIEPNVPPVDDVLESFKYLSDKLGKEKVSLRYDPIFINEKFIEISRLHTLKRDNYKIPYSSAAFAKAVALSMDFLSTTGA